MNVKAVVTAVLACAGIAALSGCAHFGMGKGDARDLGSVNGNDPVDETYVAKVDAAAHENGVKVVWINPPDKPRRN